jgi:uncharacterized protein YjbI with pentapeptide repeats
MLALAQRCGDGKLRLGSITVKASKAAVSRKELHEAAVAAWCEVFGVEPPTAEDLKQEQATEQRRRQEVREQMLKDLRGGPAGVKRWNKRFETEWEKWGKVTSFAATDLSGARLQGVDLSGLNWSGSNFDGATLTKARLDCVNAKGATFRKTMLNQSDLYSTNLTAADFAGATLQQCNLTTTNCTQASFRDADLREAKFNFANLRGADFTGANLQGATFERTTYDENTRWPADFEAVKGLLWAGTGKPTLIRKVSPLAGPLDLPMFLKRLEETISEPARLAKALAMLKADRFKLFSEVEDESLNGVVKSQSDPTLVYSCRLAADGSYACCTQNLNRCGGLGSGGLCKHLLVLIIGLAKGGQLDPGKVDEWVQASSGRKPELDAELMSETLLRYKGAEAGEIDWRPTETIPEDYYAL